MTDLVKLTDLDATDSFLVNDSGAGADKRVEFSDLQSEVLNGAAIGTGTAITELQVDNLNLNGNTLSSTDTNGNVLIQPNGTGDVIINESGADVDFRVEASGVVNALFVDGTNGRIGLNTATPSEQLHIVNADDAVLKIESNGTDSTDDARIELTTTNGNFSIQNDRSIGTSGALTFAGNTSNNIVIDHDTGDVGIGGTPTEKLHVFGSGNVVKFERSGVGTILFGLDSTKNEIFSRDGSTGAQPLAIYVGSSEKVRIDSDGLKFNGDTAAVNALNDYDTGTYTATLTCSTSGTITLNSSVNTLAYTKIGRMMTIQGAVDVSSVSSPVGHVSLLLPTAIADLSEQAERGGFLIPIRNGSSNMYNYFALCIAGESAVRIYKIGTTDFTDDSAQTFGGDETIYVNFSYVSA